MAAQYPYIWHDGELVAAIAIIALSILVIRAIATLAK